MGRKTVDWSDLHHLYVVQQLGCKSIAKVKGCNPISVYEALQRNNIRTRSPSEAARRGVFHHRYKHGVCANGYQRFRVGGGIRLKRHRVVAESVLGRPLKAEEVVHHDNEIKTDNRPENLWVFPDHSAHITYHKSGTIHPDTIFLKDYLK